MEGRRRSGENVHFQLQRLVRGDREAMEWMFDRFGEGLLRRLRRRYEYPGGIEAEDLLQDAFVFYFQREAKVLRDFLDRVPVDEQTELRFERHLWDLACGLASNRRRSLRRAPDAVEPTESTLASPLPGPERRTAEREWLARLDRCLRAGGERIYLYFQLRFRDGYTPQEIAAMTGWSLKTTYRLRQRLNEALESCRERLGGGPAEPGLDRD